MKSLSLVLLAGLSFAQTSCPSPDLEMQTIVTELLSTLGQGCSVSTDVSSVKASINTVLMPRVDSGMMTKQVLGRKYWVESSEEDRKKLQGLIELLLVKQYAEAFDCHYLSNKIDIQPFRGRVKSIAQVEASVSLPEGGVLQVKYIMRCKDAEWRILDVVIGGVSVVQTYRSQFNQLLVQGGIHRLNHYLESKLVSNIDDL